MHGTNIGDYLAITGYCDHIHLSFEKEYWIPLCVGVHAANYLRLRQAYFSCIGDQYQRPHPPQISVRSVRSVRSVSRFRPRASWINFL